MEIYILSKKQTKKEKHQQVAILLERYTTRWDKFVFLSDAAQEQKNILTRKYPLIAKALSLIGLDGLEKTEYEAAEIHKAIKEVEKSNEILRLAPFVQAAFTENTEPNEKEVLAILMTTYQLNHAKFKVAACHITRYFDARRSTKTGNNVYIVKEKRTTEAIEKVIQKS